MRPLWTIQTRTEIRPIEDEWTADCEECGENHNHRTKPKACLKNKATIDITYFLKGMYVAVTHELCDDFSQP